MSVLAFADVPAYLESIDIPLLGAEDLIGKMERSIIEGLICT